VSEPTACARARSCPDPSSTAAYCDRCDLLVGLEGFHVLDVAERDGKRGPWLRVVVESAPQVMGCPACGVVAGSHGRSNVTLVDTPCFGRPVQLVWRKRTWKCAELACPVGVVTEQHPDLARPRALLTVRACWWAIGQLRREHASVAGIARQLGTTWRTVWKSIQPLLKAMADDETRFAGVNSLGVDEHVWHHVSTKPTEQGGRGPKELTGMVDLTRDQHGRTRARLLDLVPGRSGAAYADWLAARNQAFRDGVGIATLDPFMGYKNAIDDQLEDAVAVLDAFHVVKLGTAAVDEVRRRVQQQIHATAATRATRSTASATSCAAEPRSSPTANASGSRRRSPPTTGMTRSTSPGSAPSNSGPPTRPPTSSRGVGSRRRSSHRSRPARSPRSPASGAH
jgi:transposase